MSKQERGRKGRPTFATTWLRAGFVAIALGVTGPGCATNAPTPAGEPTAKTQHRRGEARLHHRIGMGHLRKGDIPLAIGEFRKATAAHPENPNFQMALATAYRLGGHVAEAERHFLLALESDPQLQPALFDLSALYLQLERYQEARRYAELLIEDPTFPRPWQVLTNLAWAEHRLGNTGLAREHLHRALRSRASFWPARLNLAIIDAEHGQYGDALRRFQNVLERKPGLSMEAEVLYRMGELHLRRGERAEAVSRFEEVAQRFPDAPWAALGAETLKLLRASADQTIGTK